MCLPDKFSPIILIRDPYNRKLSYKCTLNRIESYILIPQWLDVEDEMGDGRKEMLSTVCTMLNFESVISDNTEAEFELPCGLAFVNVHCQWMIDC